MELFDDLWMFAALHTSFINAYKILKYFLINNVFNILLHEIKQSLAQGKAVPMVKVEKG